MRFFKSVMRSATLAGGVLAGQMVNAEPDQVSGLSTEFFLDTLANDASLYVPMDSLFDLPNGFAVDPLEFGEERDWCAGPRMNYAFNSHFAGIDLEYGPYAQAQYCSGSLALDAREHISELRAAAVDYATSRIVNEAADFGKNYGISGDTVRDHIEEPVREASSFIIHNIHKVEALSEDDLDIPDLPDYVPQRIENGIYHLRDQLIEASEEIAASRPVQTAKRIENFRFPDADARMIDLSAGAFARASAPLTETISAAAEVAIGYTVNGIYAGDMHKGKAGGAYFTGPQGSARFDIGTGNMTAFVQKTFAWEQQGMEGSSRIPDEDPRVGISFTNDEQTRSFDISGQGDEIGAGFEIRF